MRYCGSRIAQGGVQERGQVREQGDVARGRGAERDRDGQGDEHRPPVQQRRAALHHQGGRQAGGEAEMVGGLAEQDRAGAADKALTVRGDLQAWSHPLCCMANSAPVRGIARLWCPVISQAQGRSSLFPVTPNRPAPIRCARAQGAAT